MHTTVDWIYQADQAPRKIVTLQSSPICCNEVGEEMTKINKIETKHPHQCSQRLSNLQDKQKNQLAWNQKQEQLLLKKHNQFGNKWLKLTEYFPQRSQRFLKNQFYSIFRRSVRRINKQIYLFKGNSVRPITRSIILKVLNICQEKIKNKKNLSEELLQSAFKLKQILILYSNPIEEQKQQSAERVELFLSMIKQFRLKSRIKEQVVKQQLDESKQQQMLNQVTIKKQQKNYEKHQISINSRSLIYQQPIEEKDLQKSTRILASQSVTIIPYFSLAPIVETRKTIQQQIYQFPVPSVFIPTPNKLFTLINLNSLTSYLGNYQNMYFVPQIGLQTLIFNPHF